jgi:signal transduction histidine kinase
MAEQLQESYAHLERKVADRTRELATVNAIAAEASSSLDLKEVLSSALQQIMDVMAMDQGQAFRLDEESGDLVLMAHQGLSDEVVRRTSRRPMSGCPAGEAAEGGKPVVRHIAACPASEWKEMMLREGIRVVVSIPLQAKGRGVGVIDLQAQIPRAVTQEELSLLTSIGQQIGLAVENARLYEQAQQLAIVRERSRLARDLHDSVTQALYGATLCAEAAARQLSLGQTDKAAQHLREIRTSTQAALREMRLLIFELRPGALKRDGLASALQARLEAVEQRGGLSTQLRIDGQIQLSAETEVGLYRIAQEALNNVLRHARARAVAVNLEQRNGLVTLEVADDGQGFDPVAARSGSGFGLCGIEERAARLGGRLTVDSSPDSGTRIRVEVSA